MGGGLGRSPSSSSSSTLAFFFAERFAPLALASPSSLSLSSRARFFFDDDDDLLLAFLAASLSSFDFLLLLLTLVLFAFLLAAEPRFLSVSFFAVFFAADLALSFLFLAAACARLLFDDDDVLSASSALLAASLSSLSLTSSFYIRQPMRSANVVSCACVRVCVCACVVRQATFATLALLRDEVAAEVLAFLAAAALLEAALALRASCSGLRRITDLRTCVVDTTAKPSVSHLCTTNKLMSSAHGALR
jgi:hypothetical protein